MPPLSDQDYADLAREWSDEYLVNLAEHRQWLKSFADSFWSEPDDGYDWNDWDELAALRF